jgi:hypothetical protein
MYSTWSGTWSFMARSTSYCGAWLEIQLGIEGVEFEEVAMRLAQRRTGPSITNFSNFVTRRASDGACKTAYHRQ